MLGRSGEDHVGFEDHGFQRHPLIYQVGENAAEDGLGDLLAAGQVVVAGH